MAIASPKQTANRERQKEKLHRMIVRDVTAQQIKKGKRHSTAFRKPHANGQVIEKDPLLPKLVDPYTLHPDVYSMDTRGHMGTDVIVYDANGKPKERILAATRERVPLSYTPPPEIPRMLYKAGAQARRRMRENAKLDVILGAAYLPNASRRILGNLGPEPMEALAERNVKLERIVRKLNPGI